MENENGFQLNGNGLFMSLQCLNGKRAFLIYFIFMKKQEKRTMRFITGLSKYTTVNTLHTRRFVGILDFLEKHWKWKLSLTH